MSWVVSAFAPFDGATSNSSLILLEKMQHKYSSQIHWVAPVPVSFKKAWPFLESSLSQFENVSGVLALGQAESRVKISLEKLALNWMDARIQDNLGDQPRNVPVADGPDVLWSSLKWDELLEKSESKIIETSYSAGTFVCNQLMYQLLNWCQGRKIPGGFVHIPRLQSQQDMRFKNLPAMGEDDAFQALCEILDFVREES